MFVTVTVAILLELVEAPFENIGRTRHLSLGTSYDVTAPSTPHCHTYCRT